MDNASNNNWLSLLRRKVQKKFKRNRQKQNNSAENGITTNLGTNQETTTQIHENIVEISPAVDQTDNAAKNCEDMKKELFKLSCYWPNLR